MSYERIDYCVHGGYEECEHYQEKLERLR